MDIKEHLLKLRKAVEDERKAEIEMMMNEMKKLTGTERERRGRAVLNLRGKFLKRGIEGYIVKFGRNREIKSEISTGDEILISKGDPLKSELIATVLEFGKRYLIVSFQNPPPEWVFRERIRIDLYLNDVTFKRMLKTIDHLLDIIEEGGKPEILKIVDPNEMVDFSKEDVEIEKLEFHDGELNEFQRKAVSKAISSDHLFLIHGPPGTGKTRTVAEIILQEVKRGNKVLATAESNTAVDNILEFLLRNSRKLKIVRLGHPSRISKELIEHSLFYLIENVEEYKRAEKLREEMDEIIRKRDLHRKPTPSWRRGLSDSEILRLARAGKGTRGVKPRDVISMAKWLEMNEIVNKLKEEIQELENEAIEKVINESDVVLATNSTSGIDFMEKFTFDVLVVDEASQATEPSCLIPLVRSKKLVMSGDHRQLPPTIVSEKAKPVLSFTLFERLSKVVEPYMLRIQYRMNEKLVEFPNRMFYQGKLITHESVRNITLEDLGIENGDAILDPKNVLIFIDTSKLCGHYESQKYGSTSRYNLLEAEIVERIVSKFLSKGLKAEDMGVITPYDDQVELIREKIGKWEVQISSVDGFQGKEKELIIISFVRSNVESEIGFLDDVRRLNVSLTRAKRKLICIGDSETLSSNETLRRFIEHVKSRGLYVSKNRILDLPDRSSKIL